MMVAQLAPVLRLATSTLRSVPPPPLNSAARTLSPLDPRVSSDRPSQLCARPPPPPLDQRTVGSCP